MGLPRENFEFPSHPFVDPDETQARGVSPIDHEEVLNSSKSVISKHSQGNAISHVRGKFRQTLPQL